MSWGKGGMVGVGKAIWQHQKVQEQAARILKAECGTRHQTGTRKDLCPKCQSNESAENPNE